jgi:uncharacterized membrane protein YccC
MPMHHFHFDLAKQDVEAAVRVGLSVGLPLWAIYAVDRLDLAVYAAFGALASLYGHSETKRRRLETQIVASVALIATTAVAAFFAAAEGPAWLLGALLVLTVICTGSLGAILGWTPRGEIFFVLALLVIAGLPTKWEAVPVAVLVGAGSAAVCVLLTLLTRADAGEPQSTPGGLRGRAAAGVVALDGYQHAVAIGAAALGALSAWLIALLLGVGHPFWAPVTVAALMPALISPQVYQRMRSLIVGTMGGVATAAVLFSFDPSHATLIGLIVFCQAAAELFVARRYGLALLFICPLAIGISNLSRDLPWPPLLLDRLTEAGLGTVIAFLVTAAARSVLAKSPNTGPAPAAASTD